MPSSPFTSTSSSAAVVSGVLLSVLSFGLSFWPFPGMSAEDENGEVEDAPESCISEGSVPAPESEATAATVKSPRSDGVDAVNPGSEPTFAAAQSQINDTGHSADPTILPSSCESASLKCLSLPPDTSPSTLSQPSLPSPTISGPQPPPQARPATHHSSSSHMSLPRRPHRSSPLSEVAFSSTSAVNLDVPQPSRQAEHVYEDDFGGSRHPRSPRSVGEPPSKHSSVVTFSPSTSSGKRTSSRSSYTYGQSAEASTSSLPSVSNPSSSSSSIAGVRSAYESRGHHRPSSSLSAKFRAPFGNRRPPPSRSRTSFPRYGESLSTPALELDAQAHKQGQLSSSHSPSLHPSTANNSSKRSSTPSGSTSPQQNNWLTSSTYGFTPRFTRLGLASPGVVLPVSAKEYRKSRNQSMPQSQLGSTKRASSASSNRTTGPETIRSIGSVGGDGHTSPRAKPDGNCTDVLGPTAPQASPPLDANLRPPSLTRSQSQTSNSKPNKLRKLRPPSLSLAPSLPDTPRSGVEFPSYPTLNESSNSNGKVVGDEVEKLTVREDSGDDYDQSRRPSLEQNRSAGSGPADRVCVAGEQGLRNEDVDGLEPNRSKSDLPRNPSSSSLASSTPSLSLSLSLSLKASSSSFHTTRTTLTEDSPSSSIFALPGGEGEVNEVVTCKAEQNAGAGLGYDLNRVPTPPLTSSSPVKLTSTQVSLSRSPFTRGNSFRSIYSFNLRPRRRVASAPTSPTLPSTTQSPPPLPPSSPENTGMPKLGKAARLSASLSRMGTGTKLKKKRPGTERLVDTTVTAVAPSPFSPPAPSPQMADVRCADNHGDGGAEGLTGTEKNDIRRGRSRKLKLLGLAFGRAGRSQL